MVRRQLEQHIRHRIRHRSSSHSDAIGFGYEKEVDRSNRDGFVHHSSLLQELHIHSWELPKHIHS
jgi:hypothetical protein